MPAVLDEVARLVTVAPLSRKGRVFRLVAPDGDAIVAALRPALDSQSFHARFTVEIAVVTTPWLAWLRQSPDIRNPLPREGAVKAVLSTMECGPDEIAACAAEVSAMLARALPEWLPLLDRSELWWRLREDGPLPGTCARVAVRAALAADAGDEPATRRDADAIERLDPASDFPDWVRAAIRNWPPPQDGDVK
ncbi:hypothetical protein ACQP2F_34690 [Actinoplanes sp. CA-030573]|uniref:hypothetical protein n=1 Tax=Actinoplanes sp. CA-030573 TaxID=3239898 RepID=UPI003D8E73FB